MALGSLRFRGGAAPKKFYTISFKTTWKVISNHPFFVVLVLYLIILRCYFPLLFSLLVSACPVVICTAVLLGTLLLHGRQQQQQHQRVVNVDERNVDDKSSVSDSLNNGGGDFSYSVDRDGIFSLDRKITHDFTRLNQRRNQSDNSVKEEELHFAGFDFKDVQTHELRGSNFDEKRDDSNANRESSFSESEGGEKFSLDVLVAEVTPTPQETRPLLGSEDPRHLKTSQVASPESIHSSENSDEETNSQDEEDEKGDDVENDETPKAIDGDSPSPFAWTENDQRILQELRNSEIEKNEHLESLIARAEDDDESEEEHDGESMDDDDDVDVDVDVDVEDDDDEDEIVELEKDGGKHVTLWTEEDEKNLRQLGCSELERNLRLENLLARRRAKRNFSMISERNLIDLDKFIPPSPIPPILTTRVNPFDNSDDTSHHSNAPPIPGSAPSVTLPRKNPFDSPPTSPKKTQNNYLESVKESKNAASGENGSSSKPEVISRKESLFRRYESFSSGFNITEDSSSSVHDSLEFDRKNFVFRRHETFNTRTPFPSFFSSRKPVFVPEQVRGDVWHPSLSRQLSQGTESVESGTSSDTEVSTAPDNHEFVEHDLDDQEEEALDNQEEAHSEGGSESSEHMNSQYSDTNEEDRVYENQEEVFHDGHDNHDDRSSSSSASEYENVESPVDDSETEHEHEQEHKQEHEEEHNHEPEQAEVSEFSSKKSLDVSETSQMSTDDDHLHVGPVFDTSPSGVEKNTAFANPTDVQMN